MDENAISVLCCVNGCDWRVVNDVRCVAHGGHPCYAWLPSPWGGDDAEYNAAGDAGLETVTYTTEGLTHGTVATR